MYGLQEYATVQFLSRTLYECVSQEKLEVLPCYIWLDRAVGALQHPQHSSPLTLTQLQLMLAYYQQPARRDKGLVSREFLLSLQGQVDTCLQTWLKGKAQETPVCRHGYDLGE